MTKLDQKYSQVVALEQLAERALLRAFNRWIKYKRQRVRLAKRLDNCIVLAVPRPPDPKDPNDEL